MKCKKCGANIDNDLKSCPYCGHECEIVNLKTAQNTSDRTQKENHEIIEFDNCSENENSQDDYGCSEDLETIVDVSKEAASIGRRKKQAVIVAGIIAVVIVFAVIIFSLISNSAGEKMNKALATHNAYEVNSLYSQANENTKRIKKYDEAIAAFLNKVEVDLNSKAYKNDDLIENGYTVVFRDLKNDWGNLIYSEDGDTIEPSVVGYNRHAWDKIQAIIDSRAQYCSGIAYRDGYKQPKEAIECFQCVTEEDSFYEYINDEISKCVDLYIEQTLSEAQEFIDNGDFSDALAKIESINSYIENLGLDSNEVQEKLNEVKTRYAKEYVKKADECFGNKDVNGAIGNIEVAIKFDPENADYKTKKDTYEMYLPYKMYVEENCLSVSKEGDFWGGIQFDKTDNSNNSKKMYHSLTWYNNNNNCNNSIVATYNLAGKYDIVAGVIYLPEDEKNTSFSGYFQAYGDGKLIYTSPKITKNVLPKDISFSVTGIQKLELKFYGQGEGGFYGFGPTFGLSNLVASKNFPN